MTATLPPASSRSTWSASARKRSGSWVTMTRVRPSPGPIRPGPARGPRRRGWSRARRAAAARARAGRSGRSPAAGASRRRARRPARRRGAPSRPRRAAASIRASPASPPQPVQAGVEAQVLAAAEVAVEQRLVAEVADPAAQLPGLVGQRAAEHPHLAAARPQQGGEDPQQRRLAGPVGAEHEQGLVRAPSSSPTPSSAVRSP